MSRAMASALLIGILAFLVSVPAFGQDEEKGDDPVAAFNEAQNLHEKGDLAGAIRLYEMALKIEPAFPEAQYQLATAQLMLGKKDEAEKSFRLAIDLRTDWTLPMTGLGSLLMDKGQFAEADRLLTKAIGLEPLNSVALTALTELRINSKSPTTELEKLLTPIVNLTGKANATPALWSARAALENALQKRSAAKASTLKALEADPKNRSALFLLADIALFEGDIARAKDLAARIGALSPAADQLKLLRANIFAGEGKTDEALAQIDSMQKQNASANELRSKLNTSKTTSVADLEKLLETNPADAFVLGRLCTLFRRENPEKALFYCRKAADAEPGNVNHAVGFGAALVQGKQYDAAVGILRKILEIVPDNFTAHANLATALYQLKRTAEAKTEFEWLTSAQPASAGAYLFLGIIHDEAGEFMDAMANYQQYLRLADPAANKLDIEKVNLRLPSLQKLIKDKKGKK
ncbi:MAG: tetratricopeptide repeat protein [Pyrinomonadaceae bacterium]